MLPLRANKLHFSVWLVGLSLASVGLSGCGHNSVAHRQKALEAAYPVWVRQGSAPAVDGQQRVFLGVGHVSGMRNVTLARSTADNRARAELAALFERFAALLMEKFEADISQAPTGDNKRQEADALTDDQAIKVLSAAAFGGVQITQHWFFADDNAVFAQARLELGQVVDGLQRVRELSSPLRDWLARHALESFDSLCSEDAQARAQRQSERL